MSVFDVYLARFDYFLKDFSVLSTKCFHFPYRSVSIMKVGPTCIADGLSLLFLWIMLDTSSSGTRLNCFSSIALLDLLKSSSVMVEVF